jgi:hypothetical protein
MAWVREQTAALDARFRQLVTGDEISRYAQ